MNDLVLREEHVVHGMLYVHIVEGTPIQEANLFEFLEDVLDQGKRIDVLVIPINPTQAEDVLKAYVRSSGLNVQEELNFMPPMRKLMKRMAWVLPGRLACLHCMVHTALHVTRCIQCVGVNTRDVERAFEKLTLNLMLFIRCRNRPGLGHSCHGKGIQMVNNVIHDFRHHQNGSRHGCSNSRDSTRRVPVRLTKGRPRAFLA